MEEARHWWWGLERERESSQLDSIRKKLPQSNIRLHKALSLIGVEFYLLLRRYHKFSKGLTEYLPGFNGKEN